MTAFQEWMKGLLNVNQNIASAMKIVGGQLPIVVINIDLVTLVHGSVGVVKAVKKTPVRKIKRCSSGEG
jgi:hypothetical protein